MSAMSGEPASQEHWVRVGKEADFIVVDAHASSATSRRARTTSSIDELLFSLIFLGDDRNISATYIQGSRA